MNNAPERILVYPYADGYDGDCHVSTQHHEYEERTQYIRADVVPQWQPIDDETPSDTVVLLGWYGFGDKWDTCTDYWHSTRGGWFHGSATHWMPTPTPPTAPKQEP